MAFALENLTKDLCGDHMKGFTVNYTKKLINIQNSTNDQTETGPTVICRLQSGKHHVLNIRLAVRS